MKKVLYATTALIATSGFAAADINLSGFAEMGIIGGSGAKVNWPANNGNPQFFHDIGVTFSMAGETDNGLTFGASIGLEEAAGSINNLSEDDYTVFLSGAFGTVTMGDTDGALDWAMQETGIGGTIDDVHTSHVGYNGNSGFDGATNGLNGDGQVLRYDYSFDSFSFAVSAEIDGGTGGVNNGDNAYGVGFKYNAELVGLNLGLGLGYQVMDGTTAADGDIVGLSVDTTLDNGLRAIVNYSMFSSNVAGSDWDHMGLGLGYTMDAWTVSANYGIYDNETAADVDSWALAINYDLGGGAAVQVGYASDMNSALANNQEQYSLGLSLAF